MDTDNLIIPYHIYVIHQTNWFRNSNFTPIASLSDMSEEGIEESYRQLRDSTPDIIKDNGYETDNEIYEWDSSLYELSVKYCAELTPDQFVEYCGVEGFDRVQQTGGALTVEYGMMDAICIEQEIISGNDIYMSSYISIVPQSQEFNDTLDALSENKLTSLQHRFWDEVSKAFEILGEFATLERDEDDPLPIIEVKVPNPNQTELSLT